MICPPFTQLNTPYPSTAYLKGFLNTKEVQSSQLDLGIETILQIFTRNGLAEIFDHASKDIHFKSENAQRIFNLRHVYIRTIEPVILYLQDKDPSLAQQICSRNFLPEASKFDIPDDLEWAFGSMGTRDQARHLATLYLEDLGDFITECVDPHFGFSRYAERLGISANSFDELYTNLKQPLSPVLNAMVSILKRKIIESSPNIVCLTVPFPGNLFAALVCGKWIKEHFPEISIVMGGGYPNTELRSLKEQRVFEFVDFICLDDGEAPLLALFDHLGGKYNENSLKRTYTCKEGVVSYHNGSLYPDIKQENIGTPDYSGLPLKEYLSVIQITNPMHRLWSDGRWNKLTMAHGCYWGKCTFCDISLDYIKNYEASSAALIVDRMEELIEQTGERGFHFVDEAAPPALMKALALEILKRDLVVSWWTNIRFEKSFQFDLCRLLAASGCIAVSGGLEVASDRLLKLIAKGVTIEQVAQVCDHFNRAGIMVHAYLMYGFPTQTVQETIDSLEIVRQMFEENLLQSAFWHRFTMTAHSPVGMHPEKFHVNDLTPSSSTFADNDRIHEDPEGADHELFSEGLKSSIYNYMHGLMLDKPVHKWFSHKAPPTTLDPDVIFRYLESPPFMETKDNHKLIWLGEHVQYNFAKKKLKLSGLQENMMIKCTPEIGRWLESQLIHLKPAADTKLTTFTAFRKIYENSGLMDFTLFWFSKTMDQVRAAGLILLS